MRGYWTMAHQGTATELGGSSLFDRAPQFRIGSEEHKRAFCRMLLDTHDPYKPAVIDWPELSPEAFARLTGFPMWYFAVQFENHTKNTKQNNNKTNTNPLLMEAILMDGGEEARHK